MTVDTHTQKKKKTRKAASRKGQTMSWNCRAGGEAASHSDVFSICSPLTTDPIYTVTGYLAAVRMETARGLHSNAHRDGRKVWGASLAIAGDWKHEDIIP